jgi:hypothetical protein
MKRLLGAHVKSSHTVLRYMGGIAQTRAAQTPKSKTISLDCCCLLLLFQPLKKEASTPSHLLVRVQPDDNNVVPHSMPVPTRCTPFYIQNRKFQTAASTSPLIQ